MAHGSRNASMSTLLSLLCGFLGVFSAPVDFPAQHFPTTGFTYGCGRHEERSVRSECLDPEYFKRLDRFTPGVNLTCTETCFRGERRQMCVGHKNSNLNYRSILKLSDDLCRMTSRFNTSVCKEDLDPRPCPKETELHPRETRPCTVAIGRSMRRCLVSAKHGVKLTMVNRVGEEVKAEVMKSCVIAYAKKKTAVFDILHGYEAAFGKKKCMCLNGHWYCRKSGKECSGETCPVKVKTALKTIPRFVVSSVAN